MVNVNLGSTTLIKGQVENATLTGATGLSLLGNAASNRLIGNGGNNTIGGGAANDTLTGGGGNDSFLFSTAISPNSNVDRITDFHNLVGDNDRIILEDAVFVGVTSANLWTYIRYSGGVLSYDPAGSQGPIAFAVIDTKIALATADFLII